MATPGRPAKTKTEMLYVRLPKELMALLRAKANRERRGLSTTACIALEEWFEREKAKT